MNLNIPLNYIRLLTFSILAFHLLITLHGFYTMYSEYEIFTIDHLRPIFQLLFTTAWAFIVMKKRWGFFVYLTLIIYELAMKLFFGRFVYGEVFGDIFFPADLIFAFLILMLYKQHYNEPQSVEKN